MMRYKAPPRSPVIRNIAYHPGGISNGDLAWGLSAGLRALRKSRIAPQIGAPPFSLTGEVLIPGDPICDPAAIPNANAASRSLFQALWRQAAAYRSLTPAMVNLFH
jgi:hypothetical protein